MIVMKFGGTSVGSAAALRRVAEIIRTRLKKKPVIVLSAVTKITDKLIKQSQAAIAKDEKSVLKFLLDIEKIHQNIRNELNLSHPQDFTDVLNNSLSRCRQICELLGQNSNTSKQLQDELLSFGEFLSTNLLSCYLRDIGINGVFTDIRDILLTDSTFGKAKPQLGESIEKARTILIPLIENGRVPVVQGFVGRDRNGITTILGRGGSDYTATLVGAMLDAVTVEIWSDVDGVLTADPSLVPQAKQIRAMSFQEAAELAYFGAKVLHPATILPAIERNIPVIVLNSLHPDIPGTMISKAKRRSLCTVKSIAYKEKLKIITVTSTRMLMAYGFMASIFDIFNKYHTSIDLVSTSEVSVSVTIDNSENLTAIIQELSQFAQVEVEHDKAIVCVVGEQIKDTPGMPAKIFGLLEDVRIYLISQGASDINISFVIDEKDLPRVIRELHDYFFNGELDPEIFGN
jgi:aspartate kinase